MRDRQVEVVSGHHVVVRVAGAVVLVAHRERGPVREGSAAMRAAEELAQLVFEASERSPGGPGRLVARDATSWLIREAGQLGPEVPIDLGILSQADTGGVAIFLHGAVTAMLTGERGIEYYRGVDAAFTVDRVAEPPTRAAAIFVADDRGRDPELPDRGIGALVEGVASACGAIVWFEGRGSRARNRREDDVGVQRQPDTGQPVNPQPPSLPSAGSGNDVDPRRLAQTQLGHLSDPRLQQPPLPGSGQQTRPRPPDPGPHNDPQPVDLYSAPTELGRTGPPPLPSRSGGTNPAPIADPAPERRTEATERATAATVRVVGFKCARAHPTDPRSAFCTVCGMPVDQTQSPSQALRPPLGMLVLDDGTTFVLAADAVLGRDPQNSDATQRGLMPIKIEDNSGGMSRAHAEIRLVNWDVTVVDRGSTNGTRARLPGHHDWIRLQPGQPLALAHGAELMLGNRVLRLDPVAPPPF